MLQMVSYLYLKILRNKLVDNVVEPEIIAFLEDIINSCIIKSEYKLLNEFKKTGYFVEAKYLLLHREPQEVLTTGGQITLKNIDYSIAIL